MSYRVRTRDEHLADDGAPKRILALDGGGLKGILTLGILQHIEDMLRVRHGDGDGFRLCHYFDLIAGTSTGSIIAAALAKGMTVAEIVDLYMNLGSRVFEGSFLRQGFLRAKYDDDKLAEELQRVYGAETTLGSDALQTGLLIVTKRLDSSSAWPLANNPRGKYFAPPARSDTIPNRDYPLWKVVRASTAAPHYFDSETIEIQRALDKDTVAGEFVDGGISPFNNPALQAFMYATIDGYRWAGRRGRIVCSSLPSGRGSAIAASSPPRSAPSTPSNLSWRFSMIARPSSRRCCSGCRRARRPVRSTGSSETCGTI